MSAVAEHTAALGEHLLDHMVTVGDHTAQAALDGTIDAAIDTLREICASGREIALGLAAVGPLSSGTIQPDTSLHAPRVRPMR
ncbi:hypothetical protein ASG73_08630 [Janibacter sp. Soil728]|nr:hypothetical protein ASG73_08630 [Janibacter sp. Soil728]